MVTLFSVITLIASVILIVSILLQEPQEAGLGAISGGATESFWGSKRGSSRQTILRKLTTVSAIVFMVSVVVVAAV